MFLLFVSPNIVRTIVVGKYSDTCCRYFMYKTSAAIFLQKK